MSAATLPPFTFKKMSCLHYCINSLNKCKEQSFKYFVYSIEKQCYESSCKQYKILQIYQLNKSLKNI